MKQKRSKKATLERELGALTKFARHFGTKRNIIVTHDSEHETVVVGIKIGVRRPTYFAVTGRIFMPDQRYASHTL